MAIGQKTSSSKSPWGEGHNIRVDVGFLEPNLEALDVVLKKVDHRLLGVDVDLGVDPTLGALAEWIFSQLAESESVVDVRLTRGDGLTACYGTQSAELKSVVPPVLVKG